jgi:hypothetical protein
MFGPAQRGRLKEEMGLIINEKLMKRKGGQNG